MESRKFGEGESGQNLAPKIFKFLVSIRREEIETQDKH